ncbi:MAG: sigma-70 family RNA polymerase sigma factor [Chthonomonadales bacterium]|nr:sigma-70 family RNA polymerase sigma factor [Chthonomonadales bacterium]
MTAVGNRDDAEDLRQEACVRCLQGRSRLSGRVPPAAWLRAVQRSTLADWLRARRRRPVAIGSETATPGDGPDPATAAVNRLSIAEVLNGLTNLQRTMLTWRYQDQLSPSEMARRLGVPVSSVYQELWRARHAARMAYLPAPSPLRKPPAN